MSVKGVPPPAWGGHACTRSGRRSATMGFYDNLAADYDSMVGAEARLVRASAFAREVVSRYGVSSALDVACGTGLYALAFSRCTVRSVGADISASMLAEAEKNAAGLGLSVDWVCAPMQRLPEGLQGPFDAITCLGNSIPHLLARADLGAALRSFHELLSPGGVVMIQLLNYDRILRERERIVAVDRSGATGFVRFYDFLADGLLRFNVLRFGWEVGGGEASQPQLDSTVLRPYRSGELRDALSQHGFGRVEACGGLGFGAFETQSSATVLLVARREGASEG